MIKYYKLLGKLATPCDDVIEWAQWSETADGRVAFDQIGPLIVSTVFLGLDHNWGGRGDPLLFETMIFGYENPLHARTSTWDEAEAAHAEAIEIARDCIASANASLPEKWRR